MPAYRFLAFVYRTVRIKLFNYNYCSLLVAGFKHNCKRKHKPHLAPVFINIIFFFFFCPFRMHFHSFALAIENLK